MTVDSSFSSLIHIFDLWTLRLQDLTIQPRYLVTFTVGYDQKKNIDAAVKKVLSFSHSPFSRVPFLKIYVFIYILSQFSENFTIVLFHYDGRTTEWDEFEWSKRTVHISAHKQTKWLEILPFLNF